MKATYPAGWKATLGFISLCVLSSASADTLYRWTDAQGNPVISDRPPPAGTRYTTVNSARYGATAGNKQTDKGQPDANPGPREQSGEQPGAQSQPRNPAQCDIAQRNIYALNNHARIRVTEPDGTVKYLTEAERAQALAQAQASADFHCPGE